MKRILVAVFACLVLAVHAVAQYGGGSLSASFTATGSSTTMNLVSSGIAFHQITWTVSGSPSACTLTVDSSSDGSSWTAGGLITSQSCLVNGQSTVYAGVAAYGRVTATITGTATVSVLYSTFQRNPASLSTSTQSQYAAGIYATNTPNNEQRVMDEPHQLMIDGFDTSIDTVNRWNAATTNGTGTATVAAGGLVLSLGTTNGSYVSLTSLPSFVDVSPGQLRFAFNIQLEATPFVANTWRFWGAGSVAGSPATTGCPSACSATMTDAVGFELNTDQHLYAVVYKSGTRTAVADITAFAPTDGLTHNYAVFWRPVKTQWFIDSQEVPVAVGSFTQSALNKDTLTATYAAVQGSTTTASITSNTMSVSDTAKNNYQISDGNFMFVKQPVCPYTAAFNVASTTTQVIPASTQGLRVKVCSGSINPSTSTAGTVGLVYGTGTNCATGTTTLSTWTLPASAIVNIPLGTTPNGPITAPASNAVCVATVTSTATGYLTYGYSSF
jgi:hypothetical protein